MTVLVTGASGFVGRQLVARLRREIDVATRVVGWDHTPADNAVSIAGVEWQTLDLTDVDTVDAAIRVIAPTRIFHLAGLSSVRQAEGAARRTYEVNVDGTASLAKAVRLHAPGAVTVFASSGEVYGAAFASGQALAETSPFRPMNSYARSKLAAEIVLQDTLAETCPVIALRLLNHTGPGQDERFVVPTFAAQLARIEKGLIPPRMSVGNLAAERDFMDVDDVIDAYVAALRLADAATGFQVFNVASGAPRSIRSILDTLLSLASANPSVEQNAGAMRANEIARTVCDTSSFRAATGWRPSRDFKETLARTLDWWRAQV